MPASGVNIPQSLRWEQLRYVTQEESASLDYPHALSEYVCMADNRRPEWKTERQTGANDFRLSE